MVFRCRICGLGLIEGDSIGRCVYCAGEEPCDWRCPDGHYICEACRTEKAGPLIERACLASRLENPVELVELILKHPAMPAYGAEHHILAAPALLAALRNRGVPGAGDAQIRQSIARLRGIPERVCATRGDCGAAASAGTVVSLLLKATIRSDRERTAALRATQAALARIADNGGPRCCRQSVYDTLRAAWDVLRPDLGLEPFPDPTCAAAGSLPDCKGPRCPYHG